MSLARQMTGIFVNLKRFDVPRSMGGVCPLNDSKIWIQNVMDESVGCGLGRLSQINVVYLLPESLLITAKEALAKYPPCETESISIGSQGVYRKDVKAGGNFGAFTANRPAAAVKNLGCGWSMIGHSEERMDKHGIIERYESLSCEKVAYSERASMAVNSLINDEVVCALGKGINVLLCIGETAEERGSGSFEEQKQNIRKVLTAQLVEGLKGIESYVTDREIVVGYEPVWAIGPGKTPPGPEYIEFVSALIKSVVKNNFNFNPRVIYGGGLKEENAAVIAGVSTIDGGLVALTRFSGNIGFEVSDLRKIIDKYMQATS